MDELEDEAQVVDLTNASSSSFTSSEAFVAPRQGAEHLTESISAVTPSSAARKRARQAEPVEGSKPDKHGAHRCYLSQITNTPATAGPDTAQHGAEDEAHGGRHGTTRRGSAQQQQRQGGRGPGGGHEERKMRQGENALRGLSTKGQLQHVHTKPPTRRRTGEVQRLPELLVRVLQDKGQYPLYTHQAESCRQLFAGNNVVVATPTASGKSLVFYVPVLTAILQGSGTALFMFPLKALARDQLAKLEGYLEALRAVAASSGHDGTSATPSGGSNSGGRASKPLTKKCAAALEGARICSYDGDTPQSERQQIRKEATVVMTNPDMLHCGILPNHSQWRPFLRKLQYIVIDEAHHYRGAFGSHFAMVLRRLLRVCKRVYGSTPQIISATATIGNPAEHVEALTSQRCVAVAESGAPSGEKRVVMWQPPMEADADGGETMASPYKEAGEVTAGLMAAGLQTLAFVPARKLTEIISRFTSGALQKRSGTKALAGMVESYRAGYTAEDRCKIERRLANGQLRGLVSTNALELGIDVGDLDATVHVGVPVHMHELWQQAGRAGRRNSSSLAVIIATQTPLDMYYMNNPEEYFSRPCEEALVDINNLGLLCWHATFAAHETPLTPEDAPYFGTLFRKVIDQLVTEKLCTVCPATKCFRLRQDPPASGLGIRGNPSLESYTMLNTAMGDAFVEEIDAAKVDTMAHEGAIVLHRNEAFTVHQLDREARRVLVKPCTEHSYTVAVEHRAVAVKAEHSSRRLGAARLSVGDIEIEHQVTKYRKMNLLTQKLIFERPLPKDKYPPTVMRTKGVWLTIPTDLASRMESKALDVAEAVQGVKNLLMCKVPQMVLCDWRDVGGHAESLHKGVEAPVIFIFDYCEGGIGVAPKVFGGIDQALMESLLRLLNECRCEKGCPSCIMGRFDDFSRTAKQAAVMLLEGITCSWIKC